jgi:hypothetical protein
MRLCVVLLVFLGAFPGSVLACRPVPFAAKSAVSEAASIGLGVVTAVSHPVLEKRILAGKLVAWPDYALDLYEVRVAVSETLLGSMPRVLLVSEAGCSPPFLPGEKVVAFVNADGQAKLWRQSVLEQVREELGRDDG